MKKARKILKALLSRLHPIHNLKMRFSSKYREDYNRRLKFAKIMQVNKSIMKGVK